MVVPARILYGHVLRTFRKRRCNNYLTKKIDQEGLYCTVTEQEIKEKDWLNIRGDDLLDIFNRIDNPTTTRFIQLTHVADGDRRKGFTGLGEDERLILKRSICKTKSKGKVPFVQNK